MLDTMRPTTVISVRGKDRDTLLAMDGFLYVDRPAYRGEHNWHGSAWANPFRTGMRRPAAIRILGRDVDNELRDGTLGIRLCLVSYSAWLRERSGLMGRLPGLRGRIPGCWCGTWGPGAPPIACHGYLLARLADASEVPGHEQEP